MTPEQTAAPALPLHPQDEMECRRCGVHCDKVVYPGACLQRACPFVYSYEAWGHTYVGCMQKVYDVEIDLDMLRAAEARKPGFGAIRAVRRPLPMCRAEIAVICRVTASVCSCARRSLSCRCSLVIRRSVALRPACTSWMSTCSPVIVPSAESRVIASCTCARGTLSVRSAVAASVSVDACTESE